MEVKGRVSNSTTIVHSKDEMGLRRGPWTVDEDLALINYIVNHGEGRWNSLARSAGLKRTGKSCRSRWLNYLHPDVRRGNRNGKRLRERVDNEMQNREKEKISDSNRNDKRLRERTDNEMQNRGKEKISDDSNRNDKRLHERADNEMQNRGKEKISESTCSWSLLTESSDTCIGTDTTFSCSHEYSGPS